MENCARARGNGTANERRARQGHIAVNRDTGIFMHQHLFGKGGKVEIMMHRRVIRLGQFGRCLIVAFDSGFLAER